LVIPIDPSKLVWALKHLLTNAIRHTPRSGKVWTELTLSDDSLMLRIRDTGPGIDAQRQSRIFEKFSPNYDIRIARSGGAGVGLSIAREIIMAHGGRIWVESEVGSGAEFSFTLPLHQKKSSQTDCIERSHEWHACL
jgi:signal transduction histidine kinase